MSLSGGKVALFFVAGLLLYDGVKGKGVADSFRTLIKGGNPTALNQNTPIITDASNAVVTNNGITVTDSPTQIPEGAPVYPATNMIGGNPATNQAIGKLLAAPYGWSFGQNWTDLVSLWTRESGWSNTAKNSSSGAYGIAQALPESKYPAAGQESGGSSASAQISWGLQYIKSRYGSPSAAWAHETSEGWY